MVHVNPTGQAILFAAFLITEAGVFVDLSYRVKLRPYLRRFPPVAGSTLDTPWRGTPPWTVRVARRRALWHRQSDPDLERHRREVIRRYSYVFLWLFGFPILVAGMLALLILSGLVTFTR